METVDETPSLYSLRSIGWGTFLGGPLATGLMMRRNFINLGQAEKGRWSLVISSLVTVVLFGGLCLIPDEVMSKVPNSLLPGIYTALALYIATHYQGPFIRGESPRFYSGWKTFGVGLLGMCVSLAVALTFLMPAIYRQQKVIEKGFGVIEVQEERALKLYEVLDSGRSDEVVKFIDENGLPAWKACLEELDRMDGALDEKSSARFRQYLEYRIRAFELYREAAVGDGNFETDAILKAEEAVRGIEFK